MRRIALASLPVALFLLSSLTARAELAALIPREILLGNPERTQPQLSPDGKRLGFIAPDKNNVLQGQPIRG